MSKKSKGPIKKHPDMWACYKIALTRGLEYIVLLGQHCFSFYKGCMCFF
jgi:hypothetical protein